MIENETGICYAETSRNEGATSPGSDQNAKEPRMANRTLITPDLCRQLLRYDPISGEIFWRSRPREYFPSDRAYAIWNGRFPGKPAFQHRDRRGYRTGSLLKSAVFLHRVAWAITHGEWPDQIDHINGDKADNRLCNLRNVDVRENLRNKSLYRTNKTDFLGVSQTPGNRWRAVIQGVDLGTYITKAEAVAARKAAEKVLGYHANHGRAK